MNKSRFSEFEMRFFLEQVEKGARVSDICEIIGISHATFYNWRNKLTQYQGEGRMQIEKLKNENARLRELIWELENDKKLLLSELKRRH